jgi:hypothetical protein
MVKMSHVLCVPYAKSNPPLLSLNTQRKQLFPPTEQKPLMISMQLRLPSVLQRFLSCLPHHPTNTCTLMMPSTMPSMTMDLLIQSMRMLVSTLSVLEGSAKPRKVPRVS